MRKLTLLWRRFTPLEDPDGEYLVLAERDGDEFILHRLEPPTAGLFHLKSHDGVPQPISGKIEDIITRHS